jgi:hypothetical protein
MQTPIINKFDQLLRRATPTLPRVFTLPPHSTRMAWMTAIALAAGTLAATPSASATTISDDFNVNSTDAPAGWSRLVPVSDTKGTIGVADGVLTITDPRIEYQGNEPTLIKSDATFGTITAFTAEVDIAGTTGGQKTIVAVGNPSSFAFVVQFNPVTKQFEASMFGPSIPQKTGGFQLPSVVVGASPAPVGEPSSGPIRFVIQSTDDSFQITCAALGYDSGDIAYASAGVGDFTTLSDLGSSDNGFIIGTSAEASLLASTSFEKVKFTTTDAGANAIAGTTLLQHDLVALIPSGEAETDERLRKAVESLTKSLAPTLWIDGNRLSPTEGHRVFDAQKQAAQRLGQVYNDKKTPAQVVDPALKGINRLVTTAIGLATTAIGDAMTAGGDAKKLADATKKVGKAAAADQAGNVDAAIEHAKQAWQKAQEALKK